MKRGLSSEEQRIQDIIDGEQIATDEEILRVYTKMKKAYDKGLGEKLYSKENLEGVIRNIDNVIKFEFCRKGYSVGRLKPIEQELDEQIKEYGIDMHSHVKHPDLRDVVNKFMNAIETKDIDTIDSLRKYIPEEGFEFIRTAYPSDVISFLNKKKTALNNGLASYLYDNEYQAEAVLMDIHNKLNDDKGLHMHNASELKQMEKQLDEQIKKYNIVID